MAISKNQRINDTVDYMINNLESADTALWNATCILQDLKKMTFPENKIMSGEAYALCLAIDGQRTALLKVYEYIKDELKEDVEAEFPIEEASE